MIEVELTPKQVDLLFPAIKTAESAYTAQGKFKACKALAEIYATLHKQIYTYGQLEE